MSDRAQLAYADMQFVDVGSTKIHISDKDRKVTRCGSHFKYTKVLEERNVDADRVCFHCFKQGGVRHYNDEVWQSDDDGNLTHVPEWEEKMRLREEKELQRIHQEIGRTLMMDQVRGTKSYTHEKLTIDDIRDRIESTTKVAHVTFYLVKSEEDEDLYLIYSASEQRPLDIASVGDDYLMLYPEPYDMALHTLQEGIVRLEEILERKRKGLPTPKQLAFFFRNKIPIPVDLTWGQASDTIDDWLTSEQQRKIQAQSERFNGFTVGMRIYQLIADRSKRGIDTGEITKLTSNNQGDNYAYVKWDKVHSDLYYYRTVGSITREAIKALRKTQGEAESVQRFMTRDRIRHPRYGTGTVLYSEVDSWGEESIIVKLDKPFTELMGNEVRFAGAFAKLEKIEEK